VNLWESSCFGDIPCNAVSRCMDASCSQLVDDPNGSRDTSEVWTSTTGFLKITFGDDYDFWRMYKGFIVLWSAFENSNNSVSTSAFDNSINSVFMTSPTPAPPTPAPPTPAPPTPGPQCTAGSFAAITDLNFTCGGNSWCDQTILGSQRSPSETACVPSLDKSSGQIMYPSNESRHQDPRMYKQVYSES
jgi:hypothetical protein